MELVKMLVLALVTPDKEAEALAAGADYVGLDDYLQKN
jgi:large subunit ribosomal protein L1